MLSEEKWVEKYYKWCLRHLLLTVVDPCSWRLQTAAASAVSGRWRGWAERVDLLLALTDPQHASHTAPHPHPPSPAAAAGLKHSTTYQSVRLSGITRAIVEYVNIEYQHCFVDIQTNSTVASEILLLLQFSEQEVNIE